MSLKTHLIYMRTTASIAIIIIIIISSSNNNPGSHKLKKSASSIAEATSGHLFPALRRST